MTRLLFGTLIGVSAIAGIGAYWLVSSGVDSTDGPIQSFVADVPPAKRKTSDYETAVQRIKSVSQQVDELSTYTATFTKQEWKDGQLDAEKESAVKIGHDPFRVYMKRIGTGAIDPTFQVIYIEGQHDGKMLLWVDLPFMRSFKPKALDDKLIQKVSKHPITHVGLSYLMRGILEDLESVPENREPKVTTAETTLNTKDGEIALELLELTFEQPITEEKITQMRIFFNVKSGLPVRYERSILFDEMSEPTVDAIYTYLNLDTGAPLADDDFSPKNPAYKQ